MLLLGSQIMAHPAGDVKISYDASTQLVSVSFSHSVKSASEHFINKLTLKLNNKAIITQQLKLQDSLAGGSLSYKVPGLMKADVIEVITNCNKGGTKSAKITLN